ncbi:MAG TPA: YciI family protein [Bacteroidales bacterium]
MKEFVLLFRMDILTKEKHPTSEQMKIYMEQWMEWINDISVKGQLANGGNHFLPTGKLIKGRDEIIDRPYVANEESVAGYIIILAKDLNDAVLIGKGCPILQGEGTSVEVRETATPESMESIERSVPTR